MRLFSDEVVEAILESFNNDRRQLEESARTLARAKRVLAWSKRVSAEVEEFLAACRERETVV